MPTRQAQDAFTHARTPRARPTVVPKNRAGRTNHRRRSATVGVGTMKAADTDGLDESPTGSETPEAESSESSSEADASTMDGADSDGSADSPGGSETHEAEPSGSEYDPNERRV